MKALVAALKLCIACALPLALRAASISTSVPAGTYTVGSTVLVDISALGMSGLYAFEFDLSYDPAVLSAQATDEEGYFSLNGVAFLPGKIDNLSGTVTFIADSLSGTDPGYTGDTLLATATFMAVGAGSTSISPSDITFLDDTLQEIPVTVSAASVAVSETTASPEPNEAVALVVAIGVSLTMRHRRRRTVRAG